MANVGKFIVLLLVALFCWGWISNVGFGKMTTGEYIYKIKTDFQQGILNGAAELARAQKAFINNLRERTIV